MIESVEAINSYKPDQRPRILSKIGTVEINWLADSGADISILSSEYFERIKENAQIIPDEMSRYQLKGAGDGGLHAVGKAAITMTIQGKALKFPVVIVNNPKKAILGYDFLQQFKGTPDYDKNTYVFPWSPKSMYACVNKRVQIPAFAMKSAQISSSYCK